MRAVLQRVKRASVVVSGETIARMDFGLLVLLGAGEGDGEAEADWLADRVVHLRMFPDDAQKMNRSLIDCGGEMIVVSQFTLYGDCRRGRRPSFVSALAPDAAAALVDRFIDRIRKHGVDCQSGAFGAHMEVSLVNDGPVTLLLDTAQSRRASSGGFGSP